MLFMLKHMKYTNILRVSSAISTNAYFIISRDVGNTSKYTNNTNDNTNNNEYTKYISYYGVSKNLE